jgi:hypothetical protein
VTLMKGECFCKAISFTAASSSKWCGHCHCTMCQRIHGAPIVTWVGCHEKDVELTDPDNQIKWYESSEGALRGACSQCGTHLFFKSVNWPGELHITRTSFTSAVDREPTGHSYHSSHADWLVTGDSLPRNG